MTTKHRSTWLELSPAVTGLHVEAFAPAGHSPGNPKITQNTGEMLKRIETWWNENTRQTKFKPRDVTDANDAKFHLKEVCVLKMHPCEVVYHVHAFVPVQAPNDVGTSKFNWDWCWWLKSNEMKYIDFWKENENVNQWFFTFTVTYWQYISIL